MKTSRSAYMLGKVEEWKRSGLSAGEFARRNGFSKTGFDYWVKKNPKGNKSEPVFFVELAPPENPVEIAGICSETQGPDIPRREVVITFPGGMSVKIYGQMLGLSANLRYFLCCQSTDMRNGFDGLAGIVRNYLMKDPVSGDVFIFLNKNRTHIKLLYWDGDGFALYYKRLEKGRYDQRIAVNGLSREMKREELMMLLEGLSYGEMRRKKRFKFG